MDWSLMDPTAHGDQRRAGQEGTVLCFVSRPAGGLGRKVGCWSGAVAGWFEAHICARLGAGGACGARGRCGPAGDLGPARGLGRLAGRGRLGSLGRISGSFVRERLVHPGSPRQPSLALGRPMARPMAAPRPPPRPPHGRPHGRPMGAPMGAPWAPPWPLSRPALASNRSWAGIRLQPAWARLARALGHPSMGIGRRVARAGITARSRPPGARAALGAGQLGRRGTALPPAAVPGRPGERLALRRAGSALPLGLGFAEAGGDHGLDARQEGGRHRGPSACSSSSDPHRSAERHELEDALAVRFIRATAYAQRGPRGRARPTRSCGRDAHGAPGCSRSSPFG